MDRRQLMEKMWKVRRNFIVQAIRFVVIGLQFWKLVKRVH